MSERKMMPPAIRLAFREEDGEVVCYCAQVDTMDDALPLGSIDRRVVDKDPQAWEEFKQLWSNWLTRELERQGITGTEMQEWPGAEDATGGKDGEQ